jgi:hypothetical protein
MNAQPDTTETLIREIARYLAAVELFRAERCEPRWLPEPTLYRARREPERAHQGQVRSAH